MASNSMIGANADELDALAQLFDQGAQQLDAVFVTIRAQLAATNWGGSDAAMFSDMWSRSSRQALRSGSRRLQECAATLRLQAVQQREASGESGGASALLGGQPSMAVPEPAPAPLPLGLVDEKNRRRLTDDLRDLEARERVGALDDDGRRALENARSVEAAIRRIEAETDPLTGEPLRAVLFVYEPYAFGGDGRAAISVGDMTTADHVAFMVPGMGASVASAKGSRAIDVYAESRWASDDGDSVAVVDWIGYDAPDGSPTTTDGATDLSGVLRRDKAIAGAKLLADDLDRFRELRGDPPPHLTVIGNSYGSTTAAIAAREHDLAADDLILTGSPGAGNAKNAGELSTGRDHTWVGAASHDPVTKLGVTGVADPSQLIGRKMMGRDPSEDEFNAQRFQAEHPDRTTLSFDDHSRYYVPGTESLANVAAIVTGEYDEVAHADPRFDPWLQGVQDPEGDRTPGYRSHERDQP
ncbi:MAG: alpha/beta hydrolase [Ilumatobacteraceae bacterium]